MRKYAFLKEPHEAGNGGRVYKIMLYEAEEGFYLFEYDRPDAELCSADRLYGSVGDVSADWDERIDERGWIEIEDPLPNCQHDAFLPIRVKGRDIGKPEWGKYEILSDGEWKEYKPE